MAVALLIVDDYVQTRTAWKRQASFAFDPLLCASCAEARDALASREVAGYIIDVVLPDGRGTDLAREVRADSRKPCLLVTGHPDRSIKSYAQSIEANFMEKPLKHECLEDFLNLVASSTEPIQSVRNAIYRAACRWRLRAHETLVVAAHMSLPTRQGVAERLGLSEETVKSRIRAILEASGHSDMREVHYAVLGMARAGRDDPGN